MNPNAIQRQKVQAYHNRVRTELSKPSSMTSAAFYRQMERSMGTKLIPIPSDSIKEHFGILENEAIRQGFLYKSWDSPN